MRKFLSIIIYMLLLEAAKAQATDTIQINNQVVSKNNNDTAALYRQAYKKPKPFSFITRLPSDFVQIPKRGLASVNLKSLSIIAAMTAVLIPADKAIYKGVRKFSDNLHLNPDEKNKIIWSIKTGSKETVLLKAPKNLNTGLYNIGQGFTTMLVAAGFYVQGKISKNYYSLQTASDLTESFIALGIVTQLMKYASGRQTPGRATGNSSRWHPFPSLASFQKNKPDYDAFPSGHLSTLMAAITILSENYPNNKLIKPVGYTLAALSGFAMINNGVHWAGDYPLAIGLGYLTGKIITGRHNRPVKIKKTGF